MSKNETHKEKMMRKKMERKNRGTINAPSNINCITKPMGSSVEDDPNRVVIGENLKSQFSKKHTELGFKEEFIGGFKTLQNDPFFSSVDMDGMEWTLRQVESGCINEGRVFHTQGDFTGIKHIALWSEEYECFLAWRLVPKSLNILSMGMVA